MSIQFNINRPSSNHTAVQSLNTSRVERILNAKTLDEAQRMGVFDRFKDWCRGGVKAQAIRQLFDQVTAPRSHEAQPLDMAHRFQRLRAMATDEHQGQFKMSHETGLGEGGTQWAFGFNLGETEVYRSANLDDVHGQSSAEFKAVVDLYDAVDRSIQDFKEICQTKAQVLRDPTSLINERIDWMSDDEDTQQLIEDRLDDDFFSHKNFKGFQPHEPGKSFMAIFSSGEGEDARTEPLLLSDQSDAAGQFRGTTLKDAITSSRFNTLRELLSEGHLTRQDEFLRDELAAANAPVLTAIGQMMGEGHAEIPTTRKFAFIRDLQPANNPIFQRLGAEKFGDVSLLDVCFPKNVGQADQLGRFDQARERLADLPLDDLRGVAEQGEKMLPPRTLEAYTLQNTQELVDSDDVRDVIIQNLDDPSFGHQFFQGIRPGNNPATFKAVFQPPGQPTRVLELSNRTSTNNELRGDRVKKILTEGNYRCLRDWLSAGFMGPHDALVGAASALVKAQFANHLGFKAAEDVQPFLAHLHKHGPESLASSTLESLRGIRFAQTNLLELFMGDDAPPAPNGAPALIAPGQLA